VSGRSDIEYNRTISLSSEASSIIHLDRMLTRGDMAGEIGHEMNNYLTILLGNLEIIPIFCKKNDCESTLAKIGLMKETVEKVARFSDQLTSYGKPTGMQVLSSINDLINDTISFLTPQNRFDGITVFTDLATNFPPIVCDSGRMQQALGNLLQNAAEELNSGDVERPEIQVTTTYDKDAAEVRISVTDNGRGIPGEIVDSIFKRRVAAKARGEGFGLLAAKHIVDAHGGRITFESSPGRGTTFEIMLPVDPAHTTDALASFIDENDQ
jgi:signal transduction histidine kinase